MSVLVHPVVLAAMRAAAESLMTDTCTLEVTADAVGEMGEVLSDVYTSVATGVKCRLIMPPQMLSDRAVSVGERETITEGARLICPYGTALAVDQRVTLTSDGSHWQVVDLDLSRTDKTDAQAVIVRIHG
jgi:hypothetical protein